MKPDGQIETVVNGDILLSYRAGDGGGTHYLQRGHSEEFHSPLYPLLRDRLNPAVCIDIGANYGYTGLLFRRAFPECHLTLVEPIPWLEDFVRYNFSNNDASFDQFHSAICSDAKSGARHSFGVLEKGTQDSRVVGQKGTSEIETGVVTLDGLTANVTEDQGVFIKIDTQGWEEHVFAGGEAFLARHSKWFVKSEFAPDWLDSQGTDPVALLENLLDRYAVFESIGRVRWNCRSIVDAVGEPLQKGEADRFVAYVRQLARGGKGWVDLYIMPPTSRRGFDTT